MPTGALGQPPPLVLMGTFERDSPPDFPPEAIVLTDVPHQVVMAAWERAMFGVMPSLWPEPFGATVVGGDEPRQAGDRHPARRAHRHARRDHGHPRPPGRRGGARRGDGRADRATPSGARRLGRAAAERAATSPPPACCRASSTPTGASRSGRSATADVRREPMKILIVAPMPPARRRPGAIPMLLHAQLQRPERAQRGHLGQRRRRRAGRSRGGRATAEPASTRTSPTAASRRSAPRAGAGGCGWPRAWACGGRPGGRSGLPTPGIQAVLDRLAAERAASTSRSSRTAAMSAFRLPAGRPPVLTEHEVLRPRRARARPERRAELARLGLRRARLAQAGRASSARPGAASTESSSSAAATPRRSPSSAPEVAARVRVSPFGIELPPPADPGRERPGPMLFAGNFTHPPNRDAALWLASEIMPAVRARQPEARLRIVGTNPPPEMRALAGPEVEVHRRRAQRRSAPRAAAVVSPRSVPAAACG